MQKEAPGHPLSELLNAAFDVVNTAAERVFLSKDGPQADYKNQMREFRQNGGNINPGERNNSGKRIEGPLIAPTPPLSETLLEKGTHVIVNFLKPRV